VYILTVILSEPFFSRNLKSLNNIISLIQQYPSCESHQWLDIVQSAKQNIQQIFGPRNSLMNVENDTRKRLDRYLDMIPRLDEGVGIDTQVQFFVYIEGGALFDKLE
jgi:hypothetical protein